MLKFYFISILLFFVCVNTYAIKHKYSINADGNVTDMLFENDMLYFSTDNSSISFFNTKSQKVENKIEIPFIVDFMGDKIPAKVYDIDKISGKEIIIAATQGKHGFSNIYLYSDNKLTKVITDTKDKLMIKKLHFINESTIVLGLLSNEVFVYDIVQSKFIHKIKLSSYTFSDFAINKAKTQLVSTDESGEVHIINLVSGKQIKSLSGNNVDNIYQIDYKTNTIACAGQDRRLSIYNLYTKSSYYVNSDFLIYSVGLSPSGKYVGYSANEDNEIQILDTKTRKKKLLLKSHNSTITKILFIKETKLFTSAEENVIYYWDIAKPKN